ncbi:MAG: pyridoxal phosphate-dependent aminotransferase family protein [Spirochaetales bacterium]|nr:pyridoxal phosphate-dependent aminotransferase family protein [Spirochaetales bacterium]
MDKNASIFDKCFNYEEARDVREKGLYPFFKPIDRSIGNRVMMEGREFIMAGSNNYLGLAFDPRMQEAAMEAIRSHGTSCSGSRLMNGTFSLHVDLEERIAAFVGTEAALCFTTGYQTNLGSIAALVGRDEHVFTDKFNHASIMDGIFLSTGIHRRIHVHRFRHNNMEDLESALSEVPPDAAKLVVTDGVFSMEGDVVDLPKVNTLAKKYNAGVYLDEAHAIGVIGETGRGTCEHHGPGTKADLVMCTFSKSFGSIGGFIAGKAEIIDYIKHFARPLIFSASMPPANIAAVMKALDIIEQEPDRVKRLQEVGRKMIRGFKDLGYNVGTTVTPIVPLVIGDVEKTFQLWYAFYQRGVYVNPVITPAVPPNRSMIRTSFMATHTDEELDTVLNIAGEEGRKLGIIP